MSVHHERHPSTRLSLRLADERGLQWAQTMVQRFHYLGRPVDVRGRPVAYLAMLDEHEPVGCLIFARPEATRVGGWYGSLEDVAAGRCRLTRWQILNLARVWLDPSIQRGNPNSIENAATWLIGQALRRVPFDYLIQKPVVWVEEPYEIVECLSYCDTSMHQGTVYRAANFRLVRCNDRGIVTYIRPLRRLLHAEHAAIWEASRKDQRAQRFRAQRMQLRLAWEEVDSP